MNPLGGRMPRMTIPYRSSLPRAEQEIVYQLINELGDPCTRKNALLELSKRRDTVPDLGPMLYHSFGTVAVLLQEIVGVYPVLNPPILSTMQSNTACNALALLQCIASHPETRPAFLAANIHRFIYPFLDIVGRTRPLEYLKLTSLGVIGALVKNDDPEVVNFLLTSEIIPSCLRNMEFGSDLSKTVATFILQRILNNENGLNYVCHTYERFSHVAVVLEKMVHSLAKDQCPNALKHVIRCYVRLSENPRAREALRQCLPDPLKDNCFLKYLKEDDPARMWLAQLLQNLENVPGHDERITYGMQNRPVP